MMALSVLLVGIVLVCIMNGVCALSTAPPTPPITGWNPCGRDVGADFKYATLGYQKFPSADYPDVDFLLSLCSPIHYCFKDPIDGCGPDYQLIPNCETAMVCAFNRVTQKGLSIIELNQYSFEPFTDGTVGGGMRVQVANPAVNRLYCQPGGNLVFFLNVRQGYTTDVRLLITQPCAARMDLISPDILPLTKNNEDPTTNYSVATGFAITLGVLLFIACTLLFTGYYHYKKQLNTAPDQYQLQQPLTSERERVMPKTVTSYMAI